MGGEFWHGTFLGCLGGIVSDGFWVALFTFLGLVVGQIPTLIAVLNSRKKVTEAAMETTMKVAVVSQQIEHNTALTRASALDLQAAKQIAKGAERTGWEKGIEEGKRQATGPMGLHTDFVNLNHGPDQNDQR
jgi:hypothetical protein